MDEIKLKSTWKIINQIGSGGFGKVYCVSASGKECALKLIPKIPGAERELLFENFEGAKNIVPIMESGEFEEYWAIVMPLAECSLKDKLDADGVIPLNESIQIMNDIFTAIDSIKGIVVHRDLKPANILYLNNIWCLADFGIARYTEASTDEATKKYAFTPAYTSPERWRFERSTAASDIYSLGVVSYEILTGQLPFRGRSNEDFREQHLHEAPPQLQGYPASIASLIDECLYKAPIARPSPSNIIARLQHIANNKNSESRSRLANANLEEIKKRSEETIKQSIKDSKDEKLTKLFQAAERSFSEISESLFNIITEEATAARVNSKGGLDWSIELGAATITLSNISMCSENPWGNWEAPPQNVIAYSNIYISIPPQINKWQGRSHSLWYCDADEQGRFGWYEVAFMLSPFGRYGSTIVPFGLAPGEEAAKALWVGLAKYQIAWPFELLERGNIGAFIERWVSWFADAASGQLSQPTTMPERRAESIRKKNK